MLAEQSQYPNPIPIQRVSDLSCLSQFVTDMKNDLQQWIYPKTHSQTIFRQVRWLARKQEPYASRKHDDIFLRHVELCKD